jgi:hypothetical protein
MNVLYLLIWKFKTTPVVRLNTLILKKTHFLLTVPFRDATTFQKYFWTRINAASFLMHLFFTSIFPIYKIIS